jgi:uncharacterized protein YecE (DUF72 family)
MKMSLHLASKSDSCSGDLRIGCCGFPLSLSRYAKSFRVVEVQQTFYQPPLARTLEKWRAQAPPEFEFTLKAWQLITHEATSPTYRRLREKLSEREKLEVGAFRPSAPVLRAWERTLECARILGSKVILLQCPARFGATRENKNNLRAFIRKIRLDLRSESKEERLSLVWEPRGEWKPEEVKELCEELSLLHGVDPFQQMPSTAGTGYFRLHGRGGYRHRYGDAELEELHAKARDWSPCYVLFNNLSMREDAERFQELAGIAL